MNRVLLSLIFVLLSVVAWADEATGECNAADTLPVGINSAYPKPVGTALNALLEMKTSRLSFSLDAGPGWLVKYDDTYQTGRTNFSAGARLSYTPLPSDSDLFARDYDYPTLSLGVKYGFNHASTMHRQGGPLWGNAEEVDYTSRIGNTVSVFGTFTRPLCRQRRWELNASLSMGVAYSHSKYNRRYAIDNDIVGSRWLIHFGAGLHLEYHISPQAGILIGADYWHVSNGALNRPNKGANYLGPSVALRYYLDDEVYDQLKNRSGLLQSKGKGNDRDGLPTGVRPVPYTYLRFAVGVGMKTLDEEWKLTQFNTPKGEPDYRKEHFHHYLCYSFSADFMVRYARRWASGAGVDIFYATYADAVHDINKTLHRYAHTDPFAIALAAKHETFYHNLSVPVSLGVYLYRAMGAYSKDLEQPYYETVGLHYTFPSLCNLRLGITVKAHLFKADYTELVLACPIVLGRRAR